MLRQRILGHWLIPALSPLILIAVPSAPAEAADYSKRYEVVAAVGWTSPSGCLDMVEPIGGELVMTMSCEADGTATVTYTAHTGDWIGADPVEQYNTLTRCDVTVNGVYAAAQAGYVTNCLMRL